MFHRKTLFLFVVLLSLGSAVRLAAQALDPDLALALATLPSVTGYEVGDGGGLVRLEGELTVPGDAGPDELSQAFLLTRGDLYPRAAGTTLKVTGTLQVDRATEVTLRQVVDGFWADGEPVICTVREDGVLTSVRGSVLADGDLARTGGRPMDAAEAEKLAREYLWGRGGVPLTPGREVEVRSTPVLRRADGRRAWRVEIVRAGQRQAVRSTAVVDAFTGEFLERREKDVTDWVGRRPSSPSGGGLTPVGNGSGASARAEATAAAWGCAPMTPPPGDFRSASGVLAWQATGMEWSYDSTGGGGAFTTPRCLRGCPAEGELRRGGVTVEPGYERVRLRFPSLDQRVDMTLEWGPAEADSVTFSVPSAPTFRFPVHDAEVTLYLDASVAWHQGLEGDLPVSREFRLVFHTFDATGVLGNVDLLPGARLRFTRPPELRIGGDPAETFGAGTVMRLHQGFDNQGCEMVDLGDKTGGETIPPRPVYVYTLYKLDADGGRLDPSQFPPVPLPEACGGPFPYLLDATESMDMEVCSFTLPAADPANLGLWELEGRLTDAVGRVQTSSLVFNLEEHGTPNLRVVAERPVDSLYQDAAGWHRRSRVRRGDPFPLQLTIASDQYPAQQVSVDVWARQSVPQQSAWIHLGGTTFAEVAGWTEVSFPQVVLDEAVLPQGQEWGLVDLKITVDTPDDELTLADNELTIPQWIAVYGGDSLAESLGEGALSLLWRDDYDGTGAGSLTPSFQVLNAWDWLDETDRSLYFEAASTNGDPLLTWYFVVPPGDGGGRRGDPGAVVVRYRRRRVGSPAEGIGAGWDSFTLSDQRGGTGSTEPVVPGGASAWTFIQLQPQYDEDQWHTLVLVDDELAAGLPDTVPRLSELAGCGSGGADDPCPGTDDHVFVRLRTDAGCQQGWLPDGSGHTCIAYPPQHLDFIEILERPRGAWSTLAVAGFRMEVLDEASGAWQEVDLTPGDADGDGQVAVSSNGMPLEYLGAAAGTVRGVLTLCHQGTNTPSPGVALQDVQGSIEVVDLTDAADATELSVTGVGGAPASWQVGQCHDVVINPSWALDGPALSDLGVSLSARDTSGHATTRHVAVKVRSGCAPVTLDLP